MYTCTFKLEIYESLQELFVKLNLNLEIKLQDHVANFDLRQKLYTVLMSSDTI